MMSSAEMVELIATASHSPYVPAEYTPPPPPPPPLAINLQLEFFSASPDRRCGLAWWAASALVCTGGLT